MVNHASRWHSLSQPCRSQYFALGFENVLLERRDDFVDSVPFVGVDWIAAP